jgi:hypothetical protein
MSVGIVAIVTYRPFPGKYNLKGKLDAFRVVLVYHPLL